MAAGWATSTASTSSSAIGGTSSPPVTRSAWNWTRIPCDPEALLAADGPTGIQTTRAFAQRDDRCGREAMSLVGATRVVVVTGGAAGIGAGIAEELGRAGAFVVTMDPMVTVDGASRLETTE